MKRSDQILELLEKQKLVRTKAFSIALKCPSSSIRSTISTIRYRKKNPVNIQCIKRGKFRWYTIITEDSTSEDLDDITNYRFKMARTQIKSWRTNGTLLIKKNPKQHAKVIAEQYQQFLEATV